MMRYGVTPAGLYFNLEGKFVEKNPDIAPYNYDEFVLYRAEHYKKGQHADYSDRLWEYDHKKFEACTEKVWGNHGQFFRERSRNPEKIEKFLTLYNGRKTILTAIVEGCNVGNGYPYWIFFYAYPDEIKACSETITVNPASGEEPIRMIDGTIY